MSLFKHPAKPPDPKPAMVLDLVVYRTFVAKAVRVDPWLIQEREPPNASKGVVLSDLMGESYPKMGRVLSLVKGRAIQPSGSYAVMSQAVWFHCAPPKTRSLVRFLMPGEPPPMPERDPLIRRGLIYVEAMVGSNRDVAELWAKTPEERAQADQDGDRVWFKYQSKVVYFIHSDGCFRETTLQADAVLRTAILGRVALETLK